MCTRVLAHTDGGRARAPPPPWSQPAHPCSCTRAGHTHMALQGTQGAHGRAHARHAPDGAHAQALSHVSHTCVHSCVQHMTHTRAVHARSLVCTFTPELTYAHTSHVSRCCVHPMHISPTRAHTALMSAHTHVHLLPPVCSAHTRKHTERASPGRESRENKPTSGRPHPCAHPDMEDELMGDARHTR